MQLKSKNILLIIHSGALGGAERQALGLAKYLNEVCNCTVDFLFTSSDETTQEFDDFANQCGINQRLYFGVPYLIFKREFSIKNLKRFKWSIQYLLKMRRGLLPYKYDIIIPFLNFPSKVAFYLYKLLPTVKTTFWHQLGLDNLKHDYFEYWAATYMPYVIGNAPNCLEMFKNDYPIDSKKLNILPQYVTLKKVNNNRSELLKKFSIEDSKIVIGMIAHFRADKYHDLVFDVFESIVKRHPNAHLVFLGNKDNNEPSKAIYEHLLNRVNITNLRKSVTVLSNELATDVLSILDIGILISSIEGTPNAVMEYMLYGLPVVASNHPGCVGLLEDSSYLVPNDKTIIFRKLSELISSSEKREIEGENNLKHIKKYNLPTYVQQLENIINKY